MIEDLKKYFTNKNLRISTYREMSRFPEISDALDNICNKSVGKTVDLDIKVELPKCVEGEVIKLWNYLLDDVFNFTKTKHDFFRKWLIDGELYGELIFNNEGDNIIDIKVLPAYTMGPIYSDNIITKYIRILLSKDNVEFDKSQIVYVNYGDVGRNRYDVMGFLEASIRVYHQLKNIKDVEGEREDFEYFLKKLHLTLKQPLKDVESGEITKRDEYRFSCFIERLQKKFSYLLLDAFIRLLKLHNIDKRYVDLSLYDAIFK